MKQPLVSVVIPTYNRPQYLPRAVASAFLAAPDGEVEVIVVPNGPDASWKQSLAPWIRDNRVRVAPIATAHANVARNQGLALARGKLIRFLDDDDYLVEAARDQCIALNSSGLAVSLAGVNLVDSSGAIFRTWTPVDDTDFTTSMLRPTRITHNCALLWGREHIASRSWDVARPIAQDTAWALSNARDMDLSVLVFPNPTGVWVHHEGIQTSKHANVLGHTQASAEILLDTVRGLERRHALTTERRSAAAAGLWQCAHIAFPLAPRYWSGIVRRAVDLMPDSHPADKTYDMFPFRYISPIVTEWTMTPHRFVRIHMREKARRKGLLPPW